ncbi:MAG: molybdopterin-guanine dinucleotide biosynthesis protein B [Paracoccaceae bacterium]|nr:MAG: molybdopterin-guanine dinucleotide biosynthesis protein B [Paracoccaceae bacterium]
MKVFGIVGWKNSGKTTLTVRLVAEMVARGLTVSTVKHTHHAAEVDHPGHDSFRHRQAGAAQVILSSPVRWALMTELRAGGEPPLAELLARLAPVDLVLVEGYKHAAHPKVETHRVETGQPLLAPDHPSIRAVASNGTPDAGVPRFDLDDVAGVAGFILRELGL